MRTEISPDSLKLFMIFTKDDDLFKLFAVLWDLLPVNLIGCKMLSCFSFSTTCFYQLLLPMRTFFLFLNVLYERIKCLTYGLSHVVRVLMGIKYMFVKFANLYSGFI